VTAKVITLSKISDCVNRHATSVTSMRLGNSGWWLGASSSVNYTVC
jgi:hypothetical protein